MPVISKAMLYKKQDELEALLKKHNLVMDAVKVYGYIVDQSFETTADLCLLVEFQPEPNSGVKDWDDAKSSHLQTDLSVLFDDAVVEVYTPKMLPNRLIGSSALKFKASPESNQAIRDKALPLKGLSERGKAQVELAENLQKQIKDAEFNLNKEIICQPSEFTKPQQTVLVELGKLFKTDKQSDQTLNFARPYQIEDSLYALFSEAEQSLIKCAYHWNVEIAKQEHNEEILQILKEKGLVTANHFGI